MEITTGFIEKVESIISKYLDSREVFTFLERITRTDEFPAFKPREDSTVFPENLFYSGSYSALLDNIITLVDNKGNDADTFNLLIELGSLSGAVGEKQLAADINKKIIEKTGDRKDFSGFRGFAFLALADIYATQAEWDKSIFSVDNAIKNFKKVKEKEGLSRSHNIMGTIHAEQGKIKNAKKSFEKGLNFIGEEKDSLVLAMIETNLGIINNMQGNSDEALSLLNRALLKWESVNEYRRIAELHHNLGMVFTEKEDFEKAISSFEKSILISLNHRFLPNLSISYLGEANIFTRQKDFDAARAYITQSLNISNKLNDRLTIADAYKLLGILHRLNKEYDLAEGYLRTSLRINIELLNKLNQAETEFESALLYLDLKKKKTAKDFLKKSLKYYRQIGHSNKTRVISELLDRI